METAVKTETSKVIPVILSGGSGSRLWPLSRMYYPKQLLNLTNGRYTMLQETARRVAHLQPPIVVCNEEHRFMVAEQLNELSNQPASIILEPASKNTAPAIALAAMQAIKLQPDAIIAVFPADHVIRNEAAFKQSLDSAIAAAQAGQLVTFGINPTKAETGFGYIKALDSESIAKPVECFVEKPDIETALKYVTSGDYYWNSGMFVFKAEAYLAALDKFNPQINISCAQALAKARVDMDFIRLDKASFEQSPDDSIDYAVMEQADNVVAVPMDAGWSDMGSWSSLWDVAEKDENSNALIGDVISINSRNTLVHSENKLVATIGLDDVVIVDTKDALLVAHKSEIQRVKEIVNDLKAANRSEHLLHREVHRPWGSYDSIDQGNRYQVKLIKVKPGGSLSLQMHHHRAEHWVVVKGTAVVVLGEEEKLLTENESVYIPIGKTHRLINPGKVVLELIEVQSGSYLGEDDIVRLDDAYKRK